MKIFLVFLPIFFMGCCPSKEASFKTTKANSSKKEIYLQRANCYIGSQSYSLAEKEIKKAIEISPDDGKLYLILGSIYDKKNENKKAIEAYIAGIRLSHKTKNEKIGTPSSYNPFIPLPKREITQGKP
ncbi:MAG: hypothetical protein AB1297_07535 [bacterium]